MLKLAGGHRWLQRPALIPNVKVQITRVYANRQITRVYANSLKLAGGNMPAKNSCKTNHRKVKYKSTWICH